MTKSKLRRTISRWANPSDQEAHHLRKEYATSRKSGAVSIAEALRARLIGGIDLRVVHDAPLKLM